MDSFSEEKVIRVQKGDFSAVYNNGAINFEQVWTGLLNGDEKTYMPPVCCHKDLTESELYSQLDTYIRLNGWRALLRNFNNEFCVENCKLTVDFAYDEDRHPTGCWEYDGLGKFTRKFILNFDKDESSLELYTYAGFARKALAELRKFCYCLCNCFDMSELQMLNCFKKCDSYLLDLNSTVQGAVDVKGVDGALNVEYLCNDEVFVIGIPGEERSVKTSCAVVGHGMGGNYLVKPLIPVGNWTVYEVRQEHIRPAFVGKPHESENTQVVNNRFLNLLQDDREFRDIILSTLVVSIRDVSYADFGSRFRTTTDTCTRLVKDCLDFPFECFATSQYLDDWVWKAFNALISHGILPNEDAHPAFSRYLNRICSLILWKLDLVPFTWVQEDGSRSAWLNAMPGLKDEITEYESGDGIQLMLSEIFI